MCVSYYGDVVCIISMKISIEHSLYTECRQRKLYKHYYSHLILGLNKNHGDHYDYDYDDFDVKNYSICINHGCIMLWITYYINVLTYKYCVI